MRDVDPGVPAGSRYNLSEELNRDTGSDSLRVIVIGSGLIPLGDWISVGPQQIHKADGGELADEGYEIFSEQIFLVVILILSQHYSYIPHRVRGISLDQIDKDSIISHSRRLNSESNSAS